ncbi:NAD-dependent succinate-semialdehyde dehydrogenase [Vibrio gallaecicus]|uniref:NAD-dependent succinate-semialdehyde dehydrogenase n=1 Tax=Vibrio gallaecicus TaxID=552386 RepID=UPI0010C9B967|nr:NAD-dependent succinate-semialdehyde dehydrogenase [Vibrio gallaecicus]MDN3613919.1 NAD-dependent succinate-semialdehyde dehydrogenase [Vibrio gallaecicus]
MKLLDSNLLKQTCYIAGQWVEAEDGATVPVYNPSTGDIIATVPELGQKSTLLAIAAAEKAQKLWMKRTAKERSVVLKCWYQLIIDNTDDLASILTSEQGKPFLEAKGEIAYAASFIEWFAEEAKRSYGEVIPSHKPNSRLVVSKEPVGVVGAITPWNFPAAMITRKCGPAFAAGCAVVLKPAPETPLTAFALAELAERAGIPSGLFNVITGNAIEIGGALTQSKKVKKISFTGSTAIGKLLMEQSASTVKKLSLELGGNAPFIIFDDADLDAAVDGVMIAKFRNAGQTCVCANRLFVHDAVYDQFAEKLISRVAELRVDDGFVPGSMIGPLINKAAVEKVQSHIDDAIAKGAKLAFGQAQPAGTNFFPPQILTEVNDDMLVARDETFGPLAALFRFKSDDEVISRANDTDSGLAAYAYTRSLQRAWRVSEELEAGMVGINEGLISTEVAPFGGVKESGLGREGARQGLDDYLETKYVMMGGL